MVLQKIYLQEFRNFNKKLFNFSPKTTIIVGPNASGKTNIIESIFLLATGKSFRAKVEEEMISYEHDVALAKGKLKDKTTLEVVLTRGIIERGGVSERVARKRLKVNDVGKRLIDFAGGYMRAVVFRPAD